MEKMYILKGFAPVENPKPGESTTEQVQMNFLEAEAETAKQIASQWAAKSWHPILFSKTYRGQFKRLKVA